MNPAPGFLALASQPEIISFAGGVPDPSVFPADALARAYDRILASPSLRAQALQYAPSLGLGPLREWIADDMMSHGIARPAKCLLVTNGAQQALDLVGKLFIDPGDAVAVTAPTFFAAIDTFNAYQPRYEAIPVGVAGLALEQAESVIRRRPKFLYLVPDFQNPTGLCLTCTEREHLLALCIEHGVPIVEDAAYRALRFRGQDLPSMAALAQQRGADALVLYAGTFSKTLAPGLRVGWLSASEHLMAKLAALKLSTDVHTSVLNQMAVLDVAQAGLQGQLKGVRKTYAARCGAMLAALDRCMPEGVSWTRPEGGLFLWLELPGRLDTVQLLTRAIDEAHVAYVPGGLSFTNGQGRNACRLSFATAGEDRIEEGVQRLARLFAEAIEGAARNGQ